MVSGQAGVVVVVEGVEVRKWELGSSPALNARERTKSICKRLVVGWADIPTSDTTSFATQAIHTPSSRSTSRPAFRVNPQPVPTQKASIARF